MSDEDWCWEFTSTARDDFDALEPDERQQTVDKLEEIISTPWRNPPDYGEPLQNSPYKKVRVGSLRLSVTFDHSRSAMVVARIKRRGDAYTADDD